MTILYEISTSDFLARAKYVSGKRAAKTEADKIAATFGGRVLVYNPRNGELVYQVGGR